MASRPGRPARSARGGPGSGRWSARPRRAGRSARRPGRRREPSTIASSATVPKAEPTRSKPYGEGWPRITSGSWQTSPPGISTPAASAPTLQPEGDLAQQLGIGGLDGEVVEQRQRLGADADQVVDVHRHAVDPDRVEAPRLLGDDHLGADAVGGQRDPEAGRDPQHARVVPGQRHGQRRRARARSCAAPRRARRRRGRPGGCRRRRRRRRRSRAPLSYIRAASSSIRRRRGCCRRRRADDRPGQGDPVGGVGQQRAVALDLPDQPGRAQRGGERGRGAGRERRARCPPAGRGGPAATPLSSVAPAITGSATWRESRLASARVNPRRRAAASVAPLRDTPGTSAHACATPSHSASAEPASWRAPRLRACGRRQAIATEPADQAGGDRRRGAEVLLDRAARAGTRSAPAGRRTARPG